MKFLNAKEVAGLMGISVSGAYDIIRKLNAELVQKGYRVKSGKVNELYFKKVYGFTDLGEEEHHELRANA
ncbi:hypothetical protein HB904_11175 [Listeria booriae]|uniref:ICEBs1 excisionase n=1 Tax=Listeria booriae TaxID=1552123 RepID=A0A099WF25_9LIST|nr:hypothetical protein [Listeria booriae]KGL42710.1 hypothetical protein EP57_04425 [Listeria booriae]MBC1400908.1 hypothetical protein [Listeria booriae]MBC1616755.1 hypothetical protein [Listeria booriae]STY40947.1 Uncharacterised protein [Listeria booriae]